MISGQNPLQETLNITQTADKGRKQLFRVLGLFRRVRRVVNGSLSIMKEPGSLTLVQTK